MRGLDLGVSDRGQREIRVLKTQTLEAEVADRFGFRPGDLQQLRQHRSDGHGLDRSFSLRGEVGKCARFAVEKPLVGLIQCEPGVFDEGRFARTRGGRR